jgi:nucleoid DNA-binding protein
MNKKEFISFHAKTKKLSLTEAENQINDVIDSITSALVKDGSVKLTGSMSFKVNTRPAGKARNPKTGEIVDTEERNTVSFSSGKYLKDAINRDLKLAKKKVASKVAAPVVSSGKKKLLKKKAR